MSTPHLRTENLDNAEDNRFLSAGSNPLITINLVVLNGEKYIRHCLDGILAQTYPKELIELNILDNNSTDKTKEIINATRSDLEARTDLNRKLPKFFLLESKKNLGMWPGQEELLKYSNGKYVLAMAVDVILDKDFIKNAIEVMEKDSKIGALEAKIYKYDLINSQPKLTKIIDTAGFQIERSRRITNIGHGEEDKGPSFAKAASFAEVATEAESEGEQFDFNKEQEIFGVEGACPFFRREALESCRVKVTRAPCNQQGALVTELVTEIFDHDYFWYGDDLDLAWRMNLFGWKQVFAPSVLAWHDRQTTKSLKKNWLDYIFRVLIRWQIPIRKRRLDWRNNRFTIIKNDYLINILKDLPHIVAREIAVFGYTVLFEPRVFAELPNFLKLLPKMLKKRKEIMRKAVVKPKEMRRWFL